MHINRVSNRDMRRNIEEIRLEEYRSLLEEHRKNRSYIFERPIIILGLVAVAMQYFYESTIGGFGLAGLIFILCYNLWFTGNRLQSDARIVAYIQLVHEGELRAEWFGWENALRQYRIWTALHTRAGDLETLRSKKLELEIFHATKLDPKVIPRGLMFYPAIWVFHFVIVLLTFVVTLIMWFPSKTVLGSVGLGATLVAVIIFLIYAFGSLRPTRLNASIELERATWLCVFKESHSDREKVRNLEICH